MAAVPRTAGLQFFPAQPVVGHHRLVVDPAGHRLSHRAGEGKAQEGDVLATRALQPPHVDAHQRLRHKGPHGLFQHLAGHRLDQALARVQVAGRRVQAQAVGGHLLDQQKAAVALDHRGHGDVRFPAWFTHAGMVTSLKPGAVFGGVAPPRRGPATPRPPPLASGAIACKLPCNQRAATHRPQTIPALKKRRDPC
jgi:hypothetical protein